MKTSFSAAVQLVKECLKSALYKDSGNHCMIFEVFLVTVIKQLSNLAAFFFRTCCLNSNSPPSRVKLQPCFLFAKFPKMREGWALCALSLT